jgi:hypothetical protein
MFSILQNFLLTVLRNASSHWVNILEYWNNYINELVGIVLENEETEAQMAKVTD